MEYAQFDSEGTLITQVGSKESLPKTWRWEDGRVTSGFNTLDDDILAEAGWYPIVGVDEPTFDSETHMLQNEHVIMAEGVATRTWDVVEIPPPVEKPPPEEPKPSVEDRLAAAEAKLARLDAVENEIRGMKQRVEAVTTSNADVIKVKNAVVGPPE